MGVGKAEGTDCLDICRIRWESPRDRFAEFIYPPPTSTMGLSRLTELRVGIMKRMN